MKLNKRLDLALPEKEKEDQLAVQPLSCRIYNMNPMKDFCLIIKNKKNLNPRRKEEGILPTFKMENC